MNFIRMVAFVLAIVFFIFGIIYLVELRIGLAVVSGLLTGASAFGYQQIRNRQQQPTSVTEDAFDCLDIGCDPLYWNCPDFDCEIPDCDISDCEVPDLDCDILDCDCDL